MLNMEGKHRIQEKVDRDTFCFSIATEVLISIFYHKAKLRATRESDREIFISEETVKNKFLYFKRVIYLRVWGIKFKFDTSKSFREIGIPEFFSFLTYV